VRKLTVATTGVHTINVWMRESGMVFDKLVLTTSSSYVPTGAGPAESPTAAEIWPTHGWLTATPEEMGLSRPLLEQARSYALLGGGSGFITRGGKLVMSWGSSTQLYEMKSTTKSIGVTALGLALKDGLVNINDLAQKYLSDVGIPPDSNAATGWPGQITLKNLATHTAGFDKTGGYGYLLFKPGTAWAYSDGGANWLADVMTVVHKKDLNTVMFNRVFTVLGIGSSELTWRSNAYRQDTINGIKRREFGAGINTSVNAMARIGYLYLRGGRWEGQQVIPADFVGAVGTASSQIQGLPVMNDTDLKFAGAPRHYGYLWWNNADGALPNVPRDAFWSWGLGDSLIVVIPSLDIVASRAGSAWPGNRSPNFYAVLTPFVEPIAQSASAGQ
jgi:CubicO group peptidase (beta-lactamase class C family)